MTGISTEDSAGRLLRAAAAILGDTRAGELRDALTERAALLDRLASAPLPGVPAPLPAAPLPTAADGRPPPGPSPQAGPAPDSVRAWQRCAAAADRVDGQLRAWAWRTPPGAPERPGGGALDGYVIGVKDVIDVAGMPTRAGSPLTAADPAQADAPAVARLRAAGAAIAGKTACTEWALNDPAPTRNPWDPRRTPGGSSAGSGVAVATGMCTATLDTQTAGDVLRPAACTGVVGFKPGFGWVTTDGSQPVAPSIDTLGVMARRVDAAAAVAAAVAGDPSRFTAGPASTGGAAPHIGVLGDPFTATAGPDVAAGFAATLSRLAGSGARLTDVISPVDLALVHAAHRVITFTECAAVHLARYRAAGDRYGPRAAELIDLGLLTPAHLYPRAQYIRQDAQRRLDALLATVDVLVLPVTAQPPPDRSATGDSRLQIPWTLCGFPALALPSGLAGGLPLGVQLVAGRQREAGLLAAARWCEQALGLLLRPPRAAA